MKHTPGPWTISEDSGFDYGDTIYSIECSNPWVNLGINISREEDARLMAAAPDLLEILLELQDIVFLTRNNELHTLMEAAIAKATGD
jgi:hypothetical protein